MPLLVEKRPLSIESDNTMQMYANGDPTLLLLLFIQMNENFSGWDT